MENVFDLFKERGLIAQATDEASIRELLGKEKITFYTGFDPTADSLHVGHFMQLIIMRYMQQAGHRPIVLLGGGTTMVGDPTGKTDMRKMLTQEQIQHNADEFKKQMSKFIDFSEGKAIMANNADWLLGLNYVDFLREIGVHFSVNKMLTAECVKTRMEKGITFTLLTTREGKKMGKTEKGAVWLDPEKTSPYEFFQYWRNIDDCEVQNCLKLLTGVPVKEIDAIDMGNASDVNKAKELLAYELTSLVHSKEDAEKAIATAKRLFSGEMDAEHMPATVVDAALVADGKASVLDLLVAAGLAPSKGEARRLVQQGGISVDGEKVTDVSAVVNAEALGKGIVIKKGKKVYHRITL